jgi:hypothetical protein
VTPNNVALRQHEVELAGRLEIVIADSHRAGARA